MMTIGEFSRASGLTVSALRFYDSVGALVPVQVDPRTNYRWYAQSQVGDGRLVARLRRVGLPCRDEVARRPAQRSHAGERVAGRTPRTLGGGLALTPFCGHLVRE